MESICSHLDHCHRLKALLTGSGCNLVMANVGCSFVTINCNSTTNSSDTNDEAMELPIFVSYLILIFRFISTVYVTAISLAVIFIVIKKKDTIIGCKISLIVNLMVSGILTAVNATVQSSIMIISFIAGVDDPIRCDILFVTLSTFHVNAFAFVMVYIDKFISIRNPLRHSSLVTN